MLRFWSTFGFTVLLAYFMYILVEAPVGGLDLFLRPQKIAFVGNDSKASSEEVQQNQKDDGRTRNLKVFNGRKTSSQIQTD